MYNEEEVKQATLDYFDGDQTAANVWMNKYALKDKDGNYLEKTPDDMHRRMAKEFARIEQSYGGDKTLEEQEIYELFKDFKYVVPQGSVMYGLGNPKPISLSNCFVIDGPDDNMADIINTGRQSANIYQRRGGCGFDLSKLRPEGAPVNNAAEKSSGAWSFSNLYSTITRSVGQSGRRGATMISLSVDHPDAPQFAKMKRKEGKVTGANVSLRITDEFMEAVQNSEDYTLQWPVDVPEDQAKYTKTVQASELWDIIVESVKGNMPAMDGYDAALEDFQGGEPGLLMWDTITEELPAHEYEEFETKGTNPCAEIPLSSNDSCRLISINLKHFVENPFTEDAYFDFEKFKDVVVKGMRLNDDLVDLELEKVDEIIEQADTEDEKELWEKMKKAGEKGRRTGLGTHGLADCLSRLTLKYDSDKAIDKVDEIYECFRNAAYRTTVDLARDRGPFPAWDWEVEKDNSFLKRLPRGLLYEIKEFGRRNIALLTQAPTGSVSICSQTSSGVEPVFRNSYTRRVKINHGEDVKEDFVDEVGDKWKEYRVYHQNVEEYLDKYGNPLPDYFVESSDVNWEKRIQIQAAQQRYIDHSISSTINLPSDVTKSEIKDIYETAWQNRLKGVTIYVEGSRSGVLVSDEQREKEGWSSLLEMLEDNGYTNGNFSKTEDGVIESGVSLPDRYLNGPTNVFKRNGSKYYVSFSYLPEDKTKQYPVALWVHTNASMSEEWVTMNRGVKALAQLLKEGGVDKNIVDKQISKIGNDYWVVKLGKMVSMCLRHNFNLKQIVESLTDIEGDYAASTLTAVRKHIMAEVKDGEQKSGSCVECGQESLIYQEGCVICSNCGWTKC